MKKLFSFYSLTGLFVFLDLSLLTGVIWQTIKEQGNALAIGVILSIASLLPFFLKKFLISRFKIHISFKTACVTRVLFFLALFFASTSNNLNLYFIFAVGIGYGVVNFLTLSTMEFINTCFVLEKQISAKLGARVMQASQQFGACFGSMLGGYLIGSLEVNSFFKLNFALSILIGVLGFLLAKWLTPCVQNSSSVEQVVEPSKHMLKAGLLLCIALGFIGFHIGSFNILVPVVYQNVYGWSAAILGSTNGMAGVGALIATLIPNRALPAIFLGFFIFILDGVLMFSGVQKLAILSGFCIGFCINYARIAVKEKLIHLSINKAEAERLASVSTLYFVFFQGSAPIIASLTLLATKNNFAGQIFVGIGFTLALFIFLGLFNKK
jgi:hypothetical protein